MKTSSREVFAVSPCWATGYMTPSTSVALCVPAAYCPCLQCATHGANWWNDTSSIYASIYVPGTGWGAPVTLSPSGTYADSPKVAADGNGDVVSVWRDKGTFTITIHANCCIAVTGWGMATAVETESGNAYLPQVALERDGDALVIWSQFDWTSYYVAATRYSWR